MSANTAPTTTPPEEKGGVVLDHVRELESLLSIPRENGGYSPVPGLVALVLIYGFFALFNSGMRSSFTVTSVLLDMGSYGFVALGVVLILIIGEIDLSVGSVAGLGSAIAGTLLQTYAVNWILAIGAGIAAGLLVGIIQGVLITKLEVPSFVITLGGLLSWQGVQLAVLHDTTINVVSNQLSAFGSGVVWQPVSWVFGAFIVVAAAVQRLLPLLRTAPTKRELFKSIVTTFGIALIVLGGIYALRGPGVPIVTWIFLALVGTIGFILQRTRAGRAVFAVGGNNEAARRAGYSPNAIRVTVFTLSGGFAALGGVYIVGRGGTADTLTGSGSLVLVAIAAAVIGGCSLFGGRGSPWAALIGSAVLSSLVIGLNVANQGADLQLILEGAILVGAVAIDAVMRRRLAGRQAPATHEVVVEGGDGTKVEASLKTVTKERMRNLVSSFRQ